MRLIARQAERLDALRLIGRDAARKINKIAIEAGAHAARERAAVDAEQGRQMRQLGEAACEHRRVGPDGIDRRADRERLAVAIGDAAAMRDDARHAREPHVALLREEPMVHEL